MRLMHCTRLLLVIAACMGASQAIAQTANSVVIWPIDPVIESEARGAAVWLENPGKTPILLQIRVFSWNQDNGDDQYGEQKDVTATPPMIRIEPAQRQLVRLTRIAPSPAGREQSYRVLIDEVPLADAPQPVASGAAAAIRFRMRYSLPLFAYGEGISRNPDKKRSTVAAPALQWRTVEMGGIKYLEIHNAGTGYARLSELSFHQNGAAALPVNGVAGYVLPGATRRWPLESNMATHVALNATVNGTAAMPLASWNP